MTTAIRHILQEDANGCGPACLAMVTGTPYRQVRDWFRVRAWQNAQHDGRQLTDAERESVEAHDFVRNGITHFEIEHYLADHGFASARMFATIRPDERRDPWPPTPIVDAYICAMQVTCGTHYVVWLRDGRVLDPATGETTFADPRYIGPPIYVIGVVRIEKAIAA